MTVNYRGDAVRAATTLGLAGVDITKWPVLDEDVDSIRANIMFTLFYTMSLVAQAQLDIDDAAIDAYQDESGIDTGASSNQYYNSAGKQYINQTPVIVSNEANQSSATDASSYTFSAMAIGAAHASRIVAAVICPVRTGGVTVSSVTIGGVTATQGIGNISGPNRVDIWWALVPTGTTADVVVTLDSTAVRCTCSTYRIINASTSVKDTLAAIGNPASTTIDVAANGAVVAGLSNNDGSATLSFSAGVTEDNEQTVEFNHVAVASALISTGNPAHTVTGNVTGTASSPNMVAASWEQAVNDMTLQSQSFTADTAPAEAHLLVFAADFTSPTYNTDLKAYVSRDGGTTWTQVPLTAQVAGLPGQKFVQGTVDISGQPSGTSMKYKITTHNGHLFVVNGASLFWK